MRDIRKDLRKFRNRIFHFIKLNIIKDPFTIAAHQWFADDGDATLRVNYPLTKNSIVLDIGGYKGDWTNKIYECYKPTIFIFEPVPEYYETIKERFSTNKNIKTYNFGLTECDSASTISLLDDGSSIHRKSDDQVKIILKDILHFIADEGIERIDLIKINIEGGEYALLKRMIDSEIVNKCRDIQIQFHDFYPNANILRTKIREQLKKTHFITYDYPFVWENWQRIKKIASR